MIDADGRQFNVMSFIKEYVSALDKDDETKEKLVNSINKLHQLVITQNQDQKIS